MSVLQISQTGMSVLQSDMAEQIEYKIGEIPPIGDIIALYDSCGLNRPTKDLERIQRMYKNSNLVITAWSDAELVGIARSLTDFSYCCYLSDLAVAKEHQKKGIGKTLIEITKKQAGEQSMLLLLSALTAMNYYPNIGMETVENGFIIKRSN